MDNMNENVVSRISAGTVFKGEISSPGDIRIDGNFDGRLASTGRLVVGETARVKGDFYCHDVDFSGVMESGVLLVKDTLSLRAKSVVKDVDISYGRLQVELDAQLGGTCRVLADGEFDQKVAAPQEAPKQK